MHFCYAQPHYQAASYEEKLVLECYIYLTGKLPVTMYPNLDDNTNMPDGKTKATVNKLHVILSVIGPSFYY